MIELFIFLSFLALVLLLRWGVMLWLWIARQMEPPP